MNYRLIQAQYTENIVNGDVKKLGINSDRLKTAFVEAIMDNTISELWNIFKEETCKFEALTNLLDIPQDEEKQRVYYYAVMKTILELNEQLDQKTSTKSQETEYNHYKYLYPVLEILQKRGQITQGKIAEELKISSNALSNFFGRANKFGLWKSEKIGKHHYYMLTNKGKNLYKNYIRKSIIEDKESLEGCLMCLLDAIAEEMGNKIPDINQIIRKVNTFQDRGISVISSEAIKLKLRSLLIKSEIGANKRREYMKQRREILNRKDFRISQYDYISCEEEGYIDLENLSFDIF